MQLPVSRIRRTIQRTMAAEYHPFTPFGVLGVRCKCLIRCRRVAEQGGYSEGREIAGL